MKINVKIGTQSYEVEIADLQARPILAKVNGETFEVWPENVAAPAPAAPAPAPVAAPAPVSPAPAPVSPAPTPASPAPAPSGVVDKTKIATAPIPGVIITITLKEGDQVGPGKEVMVLEAMKMKNSIRANRAGTIARILVQPGALVKAGQPLFEYA